MHSGSRATTARWALAIGGLGTIVLVYHRWVHVNPTTVALTLLLFILVLAAEWGLRYAVAIAIAATAFYNFFFLPPVGTFTISDPQNWLALFAFLATAVIASRLSERAREQAADAEAQRRELEILFCLSSELMQTDGVASLLTFIPAAVANVAGARGAVLFLAEGDGLHPAGDFDLSRLELLQLRNLVESLPRAHTEGSTLRIPVRSGVRATGLLLLRDVGLSMATADAIGGLVGISIDRVQALDTLARGEAAKENERLRALMIDSVTHELLTPLTSIKGAATALLQSGLPVQHGHELLSIIDEECDRMNRLVAEAVEMARLDAASVRLRIAPSPVSDLIERALDACAWVEEQHTVRKDIIPSIAVRVDPHLLAKVLCNLLENAAKYSEPGTPITISAGRTRDEVTISVTDQGHGIDPSEQPLIFERFYRGRAGHSVAGGTGMGLAISRAIVEAHQGHLEVSSTPGSGSVFTILLPTM